MTVRPDTKMDKVEDRRRTGCLCKHLSITRGCGVEIRQFYRHRMDLLIAQRGVFRQALPQVGRISVAVPQRGESLVHLDSVHTIPRNVFAGQLAEHLPRGTTTADGQDEATARHKGFPRLGGNEPGSRLGHGIGEDLHLYELFSVSDWSVATGLCQPPVGETISSTSLGPQVFGSYTWTGVSAFNTGSTMRQASSA